MVVAFRQSRQHKDSTGIPDHPHSEHIRLRFSRHVGETVLAARSFAARSIDSRGGDQRWDRAAIITRRLFTVASATSQPVQRVGPSINVAALPNPPDEASDIAASLQLLGLGERHPAS
jgi:hypothetical protein